MEPHVKSAKTRKLFNAGVSASAQIGKTTDPTCYNAARSKKGPGCLTMWRMNMNQIGDYVIVRRGHHYGVRMAGAEEYISTHETEKEAKAAVGRYQVADRRRSA